ncbi:FAD/NAD(P)-binding oxidoreductase [Candidatus Solincola tengchongensis]|uniref:NAD(P)/FAD-dependent oxidoreductase n=1 Tax=Candidatus Solincola tengchongensis TaxID=2900693 RepID=UPI00257E9AB3|nr:FAD/NAD(P)-binding oxidoreductase [Candidatus Solincola tengchongensis]
MSLRCEEHPLVVVGAGPAGLCAAAAAAGAGLPALVLDEASRGGGQLTKQIHRFFGSREHGAGKRGFEIAEELESRCLEAGVEIRLGHRVLGFFRDGRLLVQGEEEVFVLRAGAAILATGAVERSFPFPGWTLPGVMGAGAVQTLVNLHGVLPGRRALMVGAGNVGLIVAYQLLQAGMEVVGLIEVGDRVGGYQVHAARLRREGVPIFLRHRLLAAEGGREGVESVLVEDLDSGVRKRFFVDTLCLAVGMSPQAELAAMRGCMMAYIPELGGFLPWHDRMMRTDRAGVYVAGDLAGVEEASVAMDEGRLAGLAAALDAGALDPGKAAGMMREIERRLDLLRGGFFGEQRRKAKERLHSLSFPGEDEKRTPGSRRRKESE